MGSCFSCGRNDETPKPMGVNKKRRCRDILFLVLFIAYWVGMWIVATVAVGSGDPRRLTVPRDYLDQYCGLDNSQIDSTSSNEDLSSKPFLYYINPRMFFLAKQLPFNSRRATTAKPGCMHRRMPRKYRDCFNVERDMHIWRRPRE